MQERYLPPLLALADSIISHELRSGKSEEGRHGMAMGRPLKEKVKLTHDLKFRVDDDTFRELLLFCDRTQAERAEVIRKALRLYLSGQNKRS